MIKFNNIYALTLLLAGSYGGTQVAAFLSPDTAVLGRPSSPTKGLFAGVDIREDAPRDVATFDQWTKQCGIEHAPGFQLTNTVHDEDHTGADWSVVANDAMAAQSPVLYVPGYMVLSSTRLREEFGPALQPALDQLGRLGANDQIPMFILFVKILTEYEAGDQAPAYPWLNSLPKLFLSAVSMTDFCYECLPPLVFSYARTQRVRFDNFCAALNKVDFLRADTKANVDALKWVYNVVTTRSYDGPGNDEKVIVPMADMFNHGTYPNTALNFGENGDCTAYTLEDVPAGSPLRISYGDPTNPSLLFATYGFLDETSPATFCKITNIRANQELLDLGYDFSKMLFYQETGEISDEVWDIMLYQELASNRADQQAFYEAHMRGDTATKQSIHEHYRPQTATALKKHVDTFLQSLEELSAKSEGKTFDEHPRLPLILQHNEFVKKTFLAVKARLDPMAAAREPQLA